MISKITELVSASADQLKTQLDESNAKLREHFARFANLGDEARTKLENYSRDLIQLSPIIEQCGYRTTGISIGIGLPPDITFHFENFKDISDEERQTILDAHKDKEILGLIVRALVTADNFQRKLSPETFRLNEIEVAVGIPPSVTVQLVPR